MARVLSFVTKSCNNVSCLSNKVIGFNCEGDEYIIFLDGGGSIRCRAGQYEYEQLTEALKENAYKRIEYDI